MKDRVIIITGGASGIGKALAEEFGSKGSSILITGRNSEALRETKDYLESKDIVVQTYQGDVAIEADNEKMAEEAIRHFGRIDVLINNAGISMRALFEEVDTSVIRKIIDTNFFGAIYATKACLNEIRKTHGSVIGISSIAGLRGLPGRTGYSASKFALNGFMEVLRTELLMSGVHVMTVCPGFVSSDIRKRSLTRDGSPQNTSPRDEKKMMSPAECARRIYKGTVRRKKIIIMTGQGKLIVWLNRFLPAIADRIVYKFMAKESRKAVKAGDSH